VVGVIIALIPATNRELQELTGVPPGVAFLVALVAGGLLGAAIGGAMEKRIEHKIFLERHPELQEKKR
jgi:hypothetical protein